MLGELRQPMPQHSLQIDGSRVTARNMEAGGYMLARILGGLTLVMAVGCSAASAETNTPKEQGTSTPSTPPSETLSGQVDNTTSGIEQTQKGFVPTELPDFTDPTCNIVVPQAGSAVSVRVTHDERPPLIREAIPNKTFLLVHAELYTDRGVGSHVLPPSTVIIRDTLFQEAIFDAEMSRSAGTLDDSEGVTTVRLRCVSSPALANEAPDSVYYSKIERELVLERVTPNGVLRRFYR
jgi:hypothetical protein